MFPTSTKPCVLTIAGSDSSGGAGVQADLKAISAQGCYGLAALTCVVAESPERVAEIKTLSARLVASQIEVVFEGFPIRAVKTGLLRSSIIVRMVAKVLKRLARASETASEPVAYIEVYCDEDDAGVEGLREIISMIQGEIESRRRPDRKRKARRKKLVPA